MLILTLKPDEDAIVTLPSGECVTVRLCRMQTNKCRVGFWAAPHIAVNRREQYEAKVLDGRLPPPPKAVRVERGNAA